jgi:hypothetical protein
MEMNLKSCGKELVVKVKLNEKIRKFLKENKSILLKIIFFKTCLFLLLFLVRPPITLIEDAKIYYELTKNPSKMLRLPGSSPEEDIMYGKPYGFPLFILPFYILFDNWALIAVILNFIFSTFTLFLLYKLTNEKVMWLFFFYPYFCYHQNFPLEVPVFTFLIVLAFYLKKNRILGNFVCNVSNFFRPEGIVISFYYLIKKFSLLGFFIFLSLSLIAVYTYAFSYVYLNFTHGTPLIAYPRLFIPFLLVFLIEFKDFFTQHFWKILIIWFIFGLTIGYFKVFYEWNILS